MLTQAKVQFSVAPNAQYSVDDIYMDNEDGLITSEVFTYNGANGLTQVTLLSRIPRNGIYSAPP